MSSSSSSKIITDVENQANSNNSRWIYHYYYDDGSGKTLMIVGKALNICINNFASSSNNDGNFFLINSYILEQIVEGDDYGIQYTSFNDTKCSTRSDNSTTLTYSLSAFLDVFIQERTLVGSAVPKNLTFTSDSTIPIPWNEPFLTNISYNSLNDCTLDVNNERPVSFVAYSEGACQPLMTPIQTLPVYFAMELPFQLRHYEDEQCVWYKYTEVVNENSCQLWSAQNAILDARTGNFTSEFKTNQTNSTTSYMKWQRSFIPYPTETPSPEPTVEPSAAPSFVPTIAPTLVEPPAITLYVFSVQQELMGISMVTFNSSEANKMVFIKTVSLLTDLPADTIRIIRLSETPPHQATVGQNLHQIILHKVYYNMVSIQPRRNHNNFKDADNDSSVVGCSVFYKVVFNPGLLGFNYTDNPVETYDLITSRLQTKVDNGRFASTLQYISAEYNATDMSGVTTTIRHMSGWTVITHPQPNSNRATEGLGTVATGIVAAVAVVLFVVTMFGYWWFMVKIGGDGDNRVQLGQIAPMPAVDDAEEVAGNRYPPLTVRALSVHQEHYAVEALHDNGDDNNVHSVDVAADSDLSELFDDKNGNDCMLMDYDDTAAENNDVLDEKHSISLYNITDAIDDIFLESSDNITAQQSVTQAIDTPTVILRSKKYAKLAYGSSSSGDRINDSHNISLFGSITDAPEDNYLESHDITSQQTATETSTVIVRSTKYAKLAYGNSSSSISQSPKSPAGRAALIGQFSLSSYTTSEDCSDSGRNNGIELNALGSLKE